MRWGEVRFQMQREVKTLKDEWNGLGVLSLYP